jgi:hypothetical protein
LVIGVEKDLCQICRAAAAIAVRLIEEDLDLTLAESVESIGSSQKAMEK